ncbi:unnamed protein product [Amoebophrya sp. A120]|nr:unnamed protein product [Amoebophrya sp. A120]|eukprot:GSA120T00014513001.1
MASTSNKGVDPLAASNSHIIYKFFPHLTFQEKLAGKVVSKTADQVSLKKGEVVIFYFSAHWCPPCRQFTPLVAQFSQKFPPGTVRIVFVSRDKSDQEFQQYFGQEMPHDWLAVDFAKAGLRDQMCIKYGVQGIPSIHLISNYDDAGSCLAGLREDVIRYAQSVDQNSSGGSLQLENQVVKKYLQSTLETCALAGSRPLPLDSFCKILFLEARQELNGKLAKVRGYNYKGQDVRVLVEIIELTEENNLSAAANQPLTALRRRNLFPVTIPTNEPDYTESATKVEHFSWHSSEVAQPVDAERETGYVKAKTKEFLLPSQIKWPKGTPVVIQNLQAKPFLNGCFGVIASEDGVNEENRYSVKLSHRETLMLKPEKIWV